MAATAPELQGCKVLYLHSMQPAQASKAAMDDSLAAQLWDASLAAVGWGPQDEKLAADSSWGIWLLRAGACA
jgi:hypothetical protein